MNILYNLITLNFSSTPAQICEKIMLEFNVSSSEPLPKQIYESIVLPVDKSCTGPAVFAEIVRSLLRCTNSASIIKLLTIIFNTIRLTEYNPAYLQVLEELNQSNTKSMHLDDCLKITDVFISCKSYLIRLPSVSDVFRRGLNIEKITSIEFNNYQSDLFRMMNLIGLLFSSVNNLMNTVGRYYLKEHPYFQDFYLALRNELMLAYKYMFFVGDVFMKRYKECDWTILDCFMKSLPEIELLCDRMEEFLMNKYFKGKGPAKKIYFPEEKIREICYHLKQSKNDKLVQELSGTADSQKFSQFQKN